MRIGVVALEGSASERLKTAILAEKLGFYSIWLPDHLMDLSGKSIDPWTTTGAVVSRTTRIMVGSNVTDAQRCHPAKLAQMVGTLSELSGNRVLFGIGAGERLNLEPFGLSFDEASSRLQRLSEAVEVLRLLWKSSKKKPVSFVGQYYKLNNAWLDLELSIVPPVYVGVFGATKSLELAGKIGDGWLPWINSPATFRKKVKAIKEAASKVGRNPNKIDFVVPMYTAPSDTDRDFRFALSAVKQMLLIEKRTLQKIMGEKFPKEIVDSYQNILVDEPINEALTRLESCVPDEIALDFMSRGTPADWFARIDEFKQAGATHINVEFLGKEKEGMTIFSREVLTKINGS